MRAAIAALATALLVIASGCASAQSKAGAGSLGHDAAALVPPGALAFVSVDTNLDSSQWKSVQDLTGGFTMLKSSLGKQGLDFDRDIRPALGDEVDLAVLGWDNGKPEAIALAKPKDEAKLRALATKFDSGNDHYTVESIGGWSVVADSQQAFDAVRNAESGRSLADTANFQKAEAALGAGDALATAYADGKALQQLPAELAALVRVGGSPNWIAARVAAEDHAVRFELQAGSPNPAPAVYRPSLLRDVPSGALAAVSFKDPQALLQRIESEPALKNVLGGVQRSLGMSLADLAPALRGEGVFYVTPGTLLPVFVAEVESPNAQAAAKSLRRLAGRIKAKIGNALALDVLTRGNRVFLTNGVGLPATAGRRLVDDQPFKDAFAAAGVPASVSFLVYADVPRLAPVVQALSQLLGGGSQNQSGTKQFDRLGTVVAFGATSGSTSRLVLRLGIK